VIFLCLAEMLTTRDSYICLDRISILKRQFFSSFQSLYLYTGCVNRIDNIIYYYYYIIRRYDELDTTTTAKGSATTFIRAALQRIRVY
jgi:hypothetical protein